MTLVDSLSCSSDTLISDVVIVLSALIDDAVRTELDYAVTDGLDELVVVA